jgi:hypothetical protein
LRPVEQQIVGCDLDAAVGQERAGEGLAHLAEADECQDGHCCAPPPLRFERRA